MVSPARRRLGSLCDGTIVLGCIGGASALVGGQWQGMTTFLSIAPHPDDEVVATGPVSLDLLLHGHAVHVACVTGGDDAAAREELLAAAQAGGWCLHLPDNPPVLGSRTDMRAVEPRIREVVSQLLDEVNPEVLLAPSPLDRHPAHAVVGRVVAQLARSRVGLRWWAWSIWGQLPVPTLLHPFGAHVLGATLRAHAAHVGQIQRNDYREMLIGSASSAAVLGPEQVFGLGSGLAGTTPYATLFSEVVAVDGAWVQGLPRVLDAADPIGLDLSRSPASWVDQPAPFPPLSWAPSYR